LNTQATATDVLISLHQLGWSWSSILVPAQKLRIKTKKKEEEEEEEEEEDPPVGIGMVKTNDVF
jgi:hypothetical protein